MLARLTLAATFVAVFVGAAAAQSAPVWPVDMDEVVEALVADEWGIEPDAVVLEWGSLGSSIPAADASIELLGSGSSGHWVARFDDADGGFSSIRLRAGHTSRRPVAARRITRGSVLSLDDIHRSESFVWGPPIPIDDPVQVGWVVQRVLGEGDPLVSPAVRAPLLVTSGGAVDIVWQSGAVRVRVSGTAAGSGGLGDEIRVRSANGKRMNGVIVAPGVVDVTGASARLTIGDEQ